MRSFILCLFHIGIIGSCCKSFERAQRNHSLPVNNYIMASTIKLTLFILGCREGSRASLLQPYARHHMSHHANRAQLDRLLFDQVFHVGEAEAEALIECSPDLQYWNSQSNGETTTSSYINVIPDLVLSKLQNFLSIGCLFSFFNIPYKTIAQARRPALKKLAPEGGFEPPTK